MADAPRWTHEPLEETLLDARRLTVSVVDELVRDGWEELARVAGIPRRRWRRHHPVGDGPLVALVDGQPAFDSAAWARFASLVPGAVALRTRTAAMLGVAPTDIRPPGRAPMRGLDLWRARRLRARLRRAERTLAADLAALHWGVRAQLESVLAAGDDGTPFEQLPSYALAARLEVAMTVGRGWRAAVTIDLANGDATARLLRALVDGGRAPGEALLELARLTTGSPQPPEYLSELLAATDAAERDRWLQGLDGWHAMRDLLLEAPPLRASPDALDAVVAIAPRPRDRVVDAEVDEFTERARHLVQLRERAAHVRADLHAGLRAVTQTLALRLERDGVLERVDQAFDLAWRDLLRLARGVAASVAPVPPHAAPDDHSPATIVPELRGIPASAGIAEGPVLVLDQPAIDAPVDGAVLVCRVTDPAWLPLMLRAAALVTERGGPLSHVAVVARELGLPAVVGATGACAAARAASRARVDGAAGLVRFD